MIAKLCLLLIGIASVSAQSPVVSTPRATPASSSFLGSLSITLVSADAGATILYTTDGTDPSATLGGTTKVHAAPIVVTGTTSIKAIATKSGYAPSAVMVETYTRVQPPMVSMPAANPPARAFILPVTVTLSTATPGASILYTVDGTAPDTTVQGSTRQYNAPIPIAATTVIKAVAVKAGYLSSIVMTEIYTYAPPVSVRNAWYKDLNGDGRIETAVVGFEKDISTVPDKLMFTLLDKAGTSVERTTGPAEIAFAAGSKSQVVVTLANPFPFGITSVANSATSGKTFAQNNIPMLEGVFGMQDSVPPVLVKAAFIGKNPFDPYNRVAVTLSEPSTAPAASASAFVFSRNDVEVGSSETKTIAITKTGDREYSLRLDSTSSYVPAAGDFLAINANGEIADLSGNMPGRKAFLIMTGDVEAGLAPGKARDFEGEIAIHQGRLRGRGLTRHPPQSIACYDLRGSLLGMAKPILASGEWELPAGEKSMVLLFKMADGARRRYLLQP